jgi:hypothetical protein
MWRSPFSSAALVKLLEEGREQHPGFIDAACESLGCIDPRTARKHIKAIGTAVDKKIAVIAELIASTPGSHESPTFPPGTNPFALLGLLWGHFLTIVRNLSGSYVASTLAPVLWLGPGFETFFSFNRPCIPSVDSS